MLQVSSPHTEHLLHLGQCNVVLIWTPHCSALPHPWELAGMEDYGLTTLWKVLHNMQLLQWTRIYHGTSSLGTVPTIPMHLGQDLIFASGCQGLAENLPGGCCRYPGTGTCMEEGTALLTAEPLWLGSEAETEAQDRGALTSALSQEN